MGSIGFFSVCGEVTNRLSGYVGGFFLYTTKSLCVLNLIYVQCILNGCFFYTMHKRVKH